MAQITATLGHADSIEARRASIRDEIEKMCEKADCDESVRSFRLAGELIIAIMNSHSDAFNAGVDHKTFMEDILPTALASALNTIVRNAIDRKIKVMDGVLIVTSKMLNSCFASIKD